MLKRAYLEITDVCNLHCAFCPGTRRAPRFLPQEDFETLTDRLRGKTEYLYFHLMGEPLPHPELEDFLNSYHLDRTRLLGVCVTIPGLVSEEETA